MKGKRNSELPPDQQIPGYNGDTVVYNPDHAKPWLPALAPPSIEAIAARMKTLVGMSYSLEDCHQQLQRYVDQMNHLYPVQAELFVTDESPFRATIRIRSLRAGRWLTHERDNPVTEKPQSLTIKIPDIVVAGPPEFPDPPKPIDPLPTTFDFGFDS